MMTRLQLNIHLRGLLGRGYSVADEENGIDGVLRLVVVRRGRDEALDITTSDVWIRSLGAPPSSTDGMLLKHLAVYIRRFFAHPEYLPSRAFAWPGTAQSRSQVRQALDPRRWRRQSAAFSTEDSDARRS